MKEREFLEVDDLGRFLDVSSVTVMEGVVKTPL